MRKTSNGIISILLVISLATLIVSYFAGSPDFIGMLFNSDFLFLPTLFSDLMSKGGHLSDWYFSQAFFFFPDYLFFFLAYLLGSTISIQIPIFTTIQALSTFFALYLLFCSMKEARAFFLAATASIMLFWLTLNSGQPFQILIASVCHYGGFLSSIVFVALWMNVEKKEQLFSSILFWLFSLLAFLATLSDALFLTQSVIPFVITVVIIALVEKTLTIKKIIYVLIPLLFSILGIISYDYLVNTILTSTVGLTPFKYALLKLVSLKIILTKFENILMLFYSVIIKTPIYGFIFFIYCGFALFSVIQLFKTKKSFQFSVPRHLVWLGLFSLISLFVSSSALLLKNDPPIRYLIPSFEWPIIFVLLVLFHNANTARFVLYATITSLVITTSLIFSTYKLIKVNGLHTDYYPNEIACIDQALNQLNVSNGIAEYWDAKHTKMLSRLDLNIAQYNVNLNKHRWITSRRYFKENYDFALWSEKTSPLARLPLEIISRINGPPKQVIHCGKTTLHIYEKGKLQVQKFPKLGSSFVWKGCELPSQIGEKHPNCEMKKKSLAESGYVTFGPYEPLPQGTYGFEIEYSSVSDKIQTVGSWDIVEWNFEILPSKTKFLTKGLVFGTNATIKKIEGSFTINSKENKVEIRTWANQNVELNVTSIRVSRLTGAVE